MSKITSTEYKTQDKPRSQLKSDLDTTNTELMTRQFDCQSNESRPEYLTVQLCLCCILTNVSMCIIGTSTC